jgi:hypothetical protein
MSIARSSCVLPAVSVVKSWGSPSRWPSGKALALQSEKSGVQISSGSRIPACLAILLTRCITFCNLQYMIQIMLCLAI